MFAKWPIVAEKSLSHAGCALPSLRAATQRAPQPPTLSGDALASGFWLTRYFSRSVPLSCVRPVNVSRKSPRHRSLSAFGSRQALSHGRSRQRLALHAGRRQRDTRLMRLKFETCSRDAGKSSAMRICMDRISPFRQGLIRRRNSIILRRSRSS
jgi:hypothetical protein